MTRKQLIENVQFSNVQKLGGCNHLPEYSEGLKEDEAMTVQRNG